MDDISADHRVLQAGEAEASPDIARDAAPHPQGQDTPRASTYVPEPSRRSLREELRETILELEASEEQAEAGPERDGDGTVEDCVEPIEDEDVTAWGQEDHKGPPPDRKAEAAEAARREEELLDAVFEGREISPAAEAAARRKYAAFCRSDPRNPPPHFTTPEYKDAERRIAEAQKERVFRGTKDLVRKLRGSTSLPLSERVALVDQIARPFLNESTMDLEASVSLFEILEDADQGAVRAYCREFVTSGHAMASMAPSSNLHANGAIVAILRCFLRYEMKLGAAGLDLFALDVALGELSASFRLNQAAGAALRSGAKRPTAAFSKLLTASERARQAFVSQMTRLLERRQAPPGLPIVDVELLLPEGEGDDDASNDPQKRLA